MAVVNPITHGDRQDVYLTTPTQQPLIGRLEARSGVREGDDTVLYADLAHAHLFEGKNGGARLLKEVTA